MFLSELKTAFPQTMLSAMDFKVDPCDNFFEYSCNSWQQLATIPPALGGIAKAWDAAQDAADADLHKIMLKEYPEDSSFRKVATAHILALSVPMPFARRLLLPAPPRRK